MSRREPYKLNDTQSGAQIFWRSLEEKHASAEAYAKNKVDAEFPLGSPGEVLKRESVKPDDESTWGRRNFLKFGTAVTALFGLEACVRRPVEKIVPYTRAPEEVIPGVANHYATVYGRRGEALGLLVESHEGRPTKIEGNPEHPSSRGATDLLTQASIFDLYDPDRSESPTQKGQKAKWEEFEAFLTERLKAHDGDQGMKLRVLAEPSCSPTFLRLRDAVRARFPHTRFHTWSSAPDSNAREGARIALGQPVHAIYDYGRAKVIVSLDCDFLQTESGSVRATRSFAEGRRIRSPHDSMSRLYMVESTLSTTGANADHRLRLKSGDVERYARLLAKELVGAGLNLGPVAASLGDHPAEGIPEKWIKAVAKDLADSRGRALVVAGSRQPASVHALAHALNAALGAVGQVVTYTPVVDVLEQDHAADLQALAADLDGNKVETLLILGGNPAYDAPGDVKLAERIAKVPYTIHLASHVNETSQKCMWHLPRAHEYETWGDLRSLDGTWSVQQPLIAPLHGGKSDIEVLALFTPGADPKTVAGHDLVRETLRGRSTLSGAAFDKQWKGALARGVVAGSAPFAFTPNEVKGAEIAAELAKPAAAKKGGGGQLEVVFTACPKMFDGRYGNNPWLLELPDPLTKIVWDNVAQISAKTAKDLGVESGDVVELSANGASVKVAAWIQPGHADGSVTLALGWGRTAAGRYGNGKGFDVNPLRSVQSMHILDGVALRKTGETYTITQTQDHHSMAGRPVAIDATLDEYRDNPEFAQYRLPNPKTLPLWQRQDYSKGHQWGMSVDLSACTGCGACVIACQSENNIAVVGKEQVGRGREMHWIRVDRYFVGEDEADPKVALQPVACVQCEEAPCENVCPVNATEHSPEGLNDMAYNRCIGTRYCANNCPYKVRRFNYLEFQGGPPGGSVETLYGDIPEVQKMVFNPDVTVRMRGVMEKCTYCVQRIQEGKIQSKREGRVLKDGDIKTACSQACPAGAIVFGDLNDPAARVAELAKRDRGYKLLADLGTHPRTTYLGKIRNPNKEMA